jgi:2-dehydropantoate 2-reductase
MRTLVLGAGAVGGYFGGRLLQAGRDVTFLVRPARAAVLAESGLRIKSRFGDVRIPAPPTMTVASGQLGRPFDLVVLSCKAYDLESAIASIAPAVGESTSILPLLNGMRHLERLDRQFGAARVLGGQCVIGSTVDEQGTVIHLNDAHGLSFGERQPAPPARARAILETMSGAIFEARISERIVEEMWEKWVLLASLAGATCLMRASIGQIVEAAGGVEFLRALLDECNQVAGHAGFAPRESFLERTRSMLTAAGSGQTASMLRDIERNAPVEADHIIGDLIDRAGRSPGRDALPPPLPLLRLVYTHLKAYETRRQHTAAPR